jgi:hypothetical protein
MDRKLNYLILWSKSCITIQRQIVTAENQVMWKQYSHIFILVSGSTFLFLGVIFNFLPEIIKRSEALTSLFIGIGLIILTGLAKKRPT